MSQKENNIITISEQVAFAGEDIAEVREKIERDDDEQVTPEMRLLMGRAIAGHYGRDLDLDGGHTEGFSQDIDYILDKVIEITEQQSIEILTEAVEYHASDPNFPKEVRNKIKLILRGPKASGLDPATYLFSLKADAAIIRYHSPYPEVRAIADPFDNPTMPAETMRAYFGSNGNYE
jgi:hypothetical protein